MNSIYGFGSPMTSTIGSDSQVVIPQITFPNNVRSFEPLTANGKEAAKGIHTPPGTKVPIFDTEDSIFYYKETDKFGNVISFETYSYTKVEDPPPPQYATVDMIAELTEQIKSLREDIANGAQSIRRQDKHSNKQWSGNRPTERSDFTDKVSNDDGSGQ